MENKKIQQMIRILPTQSGAIVIEDLYEIYSQKEKA